MSGSKILDGLKDAVAGNFASVTIEGQRWVRADAPETRIHQINGPFASPMLGQEVKMPKYEYQKDDSQTCSASFSGYGEYTPVTVSGSAAAATPPAAAPDQGVREALEAAQNSGGLVPVRPGVYAALSRPAPDAAGSELPKPLIGAIVAALGQRVRLMHDNGKDQAREDLNAFKKWADAREVVSSP